MSDIYAELRDLSPEQRELMLDMLEKEGVDLSRQPIPQRRDAQVAPMSAAQRRLWTMHSLASGLPTENVPVAIEIVGQIDTVALSKSVNFLISHHEILRTTFHDEGGQLMQRIHDYEETPLPVIAVDAGTEGFAAPAVARALVEHAEQLFRLAVDFSMRPVLLQLSDGSSVLLLTFHQLVVDGWAINVLLQQLTDTYQAFVNNRMPAPLGSEVHYADFAEWQNEGWEDARIAKQVDYWVGQLQGAPARLLLPTGHADSNRQDFRGALTLFSLDGEVAEALRGLAKQAGVTLFTTVLATLKVLLAAYTNQPDIVVGTLISRRSRPETENMIGNFGNNLLLRSQVSSDLNFKQVMQRVNDATLDSMANQDAPLELVNTKLHEQSNQHVPAFQVGFIFREGGIQDRLKLPGLEVRQRFVDLGTARLDLWLDLADHGHELSGEIQYRSAVFTGEQMQQLLQDWREAIAQLVAHPDLPIADLEILADNRKLTASQGAQLEALLMKHDAVQVARVSNVGALCTGPTQIDFVRSQGSEITGSMLREYLATSSNFQLGPTMFRETDQIENLENRLATKHDDPVPMNAIEKQVAAIWQRELGVAYIDVGDNFFDLGGHSLLAVNVLKQISAISSTSPDAKSLVTGTLRQLAAQLSLSDENS